MWPRACGVPEQPPGGLQRSAVGVDLGHASGGWRVQDADASEDRFSHLIKRKLRCSRRSRHAHTMLVVDGLLAELAHRAVGTGYACARRVTRQATRHPETPHRKAGGIPSEHVRCPVIRRWPARDGIDMSCRCAGSTRPRSVCHLQASSRQHPTRKIKLVPLSYGPTLINRRSSARARIGCGRGGRKFDRVGGVTCRFINRGSYHAPRAQQIAHN